MNPLHSLQSDGSSSQNPFALDVRRFPGAQHTLCIACKRVQWVHGRGLHPPFQRVWDPHEPFARNAEGSSGIPRAHCNGCKTHLGR